MGPSHGIPHYIMEETEARHAAYLQTADQWRAEGAPWDSTPRWRSRRWGRIARSLAAVRKWLHVPRWSRV